jgi:diacylglycerol kinase (ATP)
MSGENPSGAFASLRIAVSGLRHLLVSERSSRIHLLAMLVVIVTGLATDLSWEDWRWIALAVSIVWLSEAFNTAIERLGDAVTDQPHPQIGVAKDLAATAGMFAVIAAAIISVSVFVPHWVGSP